MDKTRLERLKDLYESKLRSAGAEMPRIDWGERSALVQVLFAGALHTVHFEFGDCTGAEAENRLLLCVSAMMARIHTLRFGAKWQ